ncbi:MAG: DUF4404 family protein [Deltaproteobacteria bacterium]|nr:DUF4404 family protein [Deltaproteobacteria bacterium]
MPLKEVKKQIGALNDRLNQIPADTDRLAHALDSAQQEIDTYTPEAMTDFVTYLKTETEALEAEHPELTEFVNRIMVTLSNIGI